MDSFSSALTWCCTVLPESILSMQLSFHPYRQTVRVALVILSQTERVGRTHSGQSDRPDFGLIFVPNSRPVSLIAICLVSGNDLVFHFELRESESNSTVQGSQTKIRYQNYLLLHWSTRKRWDRDKVHRQLHALLPVHGRRPRKDHNGLNW